MGRPRKEQVSLVEPSQVVAESSSVAVEQEPEKVIEHPRDALSRLRDEQIQRDQARRDARKGRKVIGFRYNPYTNKPRKQGYGELCLLQFTPALSRLESTLIANDVPLADGIRLMTMDEPKAQKEHEERKAKGNYGFPKLKLPNKL